MKPVILEFFDRSPWIEVSCEETIEWDFTNQKVNLKYGRYMELNPEINESR